MPGEVTRHIADLTAREAAGEVVTKKRKERSDKGTAKGPRRKPGANNGVAEEEDETGRALKEEEGSYEVQGNRKVPEDPASFKQ